MKLVDCAKIREEILEEVKQKVASKGYIPALAIVTASDDYASTIYVRNKIKTCESLGITVTHHNLEPNNYNQSELEAFVYDLNELYDGIMVQLPLDKKYNSQKIINQIDPYKDVDGLTTFQKGLLVDNSKDAIIPCTALGCKMIVDKVYNGSNGKNVTIINRSDLIGKPLATLLRNDNATVTVCHTKTNERTLNKLLKTSDIVVTGTGNAHIFKGDDFNKCNQLVIDCSIVRDRNGKICGDVYTDSLFSDDTFILSPSPKGVGSLVTALVCYNLMRCCDLQEKYDNIEYDWNE